MGAAIIWAPVLIRHSSLPVAVSRAKNWPSIRPDLRVREVIVKGIPGTFMQAWDLEFGGPLIDQEIDAVTFYILSWQEGGPIFIFPTSTPSLRPALTPPPGVTGDPNRGALLFASNCAVCHGLNGEGRVGATLAKDWPSIRPDLRVRDTITNGAPGALMPAWSQANGGPLSEEEIDGVTCYILSWQTGGGVISFPTPTPFSGPVLTPPPGVIGDPNSGAVLYDQNCAVCHGTQGEGAVGPALTAHGPTSSTHWRPFMFEEPVRTGKTSGTVLPISVVSDRLWGPLF